MSRKIFIALFMTFACCGVGMAQNSVSAAPKSASEVSAAPVAPKEINGIGRMVVNVVDENNMPINNAYAKLDSYRTDGFHCESWNWTNASGQSALPPIHMGKLKLKVKAKGYEDQKVEVPYNSLSEPVRVTLKKK